ncbi:MAG: glycerol-3-phosphate acyltransferase [Anaerolineae bacterium]|jgi:glycerol-3-phosphate acyltransferase PlsY
MDLLIALLAITAGYLAGSISFARLVTRLFAPEQDISRIEIEVPDSEERFESGAISATSVRLHLGPRYGCLTSILDILKATIPTLAFKLWQPEAPYYLLAAGMAAIGHNWPIYYRFKGGRGMSPIMGGMLVVDPLGVVVTNLLGLLSDLAIKSTLVSSGVWLVLMIPWLWLRDRGGPEMVYAVAMTILFWGAMIPEWRELLRLRREGALDNLQRAREVRVASRRDGGTAQQMSVSDLLSTLVSWLRRSDRER